MKPVQSLTALLCVLLMAAPPGSAQQAPTLQQDDIHVDLGPQKWYSPFTRDYTVRDVKPINMGNSGRLDSLLRAGNLYLSLHDAVALALENNIDIEASRYNFLITESRLRGSKAGGNGLPSYDPVFTSNLNWGHTTQAQSNTVTSGGLTASVNDTRLLNFGLQQGFASGATATLGLNNNQTTTNILNANYNPSTNSNLQLQISQPLLEGFGLAYNRQNIYIARNNVRGADYTFEQQIITTVNQVVTAYWNLVNATLDVEAKRQDLERAQKLYDDNQKQVEIGTLAPIAVVQAESEVANRQLDLITSQTNVLTQEVNLKNLLSRNGLGSPSLLSAHVIPTDRIQIPEVEPVTPIQDLMETAVQKRPDLASTRVTLDNSKISLNAARNIALPTLNLVSTLQNNALSGEINPAPNINPITGVITARQTNPYFVGGYGNVLAQLFRRNFPNYSIGLQLTIPLRNRAAKEAYSTAALQLRQNELTLQRSVNQVKADIQNAVNNVTQARARYQAATKARALQEQTLDAEQKKLALGASTVYNVILIQRDLANARQTEVTALTAYGLAKLQLDVASGMLLEHNNIIMDEAKSGRVSRPPDPIIDTAPANGQNGGAR